MLHYGFKIKAYIFFSFLTKEGIYNEFIGYFVTKNGHKYRTTWNYPLNTKEYFLTTLCSHYMFNAFDWGKTKEGFNFWDKMNDKWEETICKVNKMIDYLPYATR